MTDEPKTHLRGRPVVDPGTDNDAAPAGSPTPVPKPGAEPAGAEAAGKMSAFRENVATLMAVAVIIALGFFYSYMLGHVGDQETEWARRTTILSGIEAIVFGAAGFLFGTSIQRQVQSAQVKNLERTSDEKRQEANRAQMRAELEAERAKAAAAGEQEARVRARGGEMLCEAVLAKTEGQKGGPPTRYGVLGDSETANLATADLEELRRLALAARS